MSNSFDTDQFFNSEPCIPIEYEPQESNDEKELERDSLSTNHKVEVTKIVNEVNVIV
jgi:hypothetical protein